MGQPDDRGWGLDGARAPQLFPDSTWNVSAKPTYGSHRSRLARWRDWRHLGGVRLGILVATASSLLVASGAGLAIALEETGSVPLGPGQPAAGVPRGTLSAALTRHIARSVDPAVVDINAVIETAAGPADVAGTGMIVSSSGEVLTNNHVIESAKTIEVTAPAVGGRYRAAFVGADPGDDIALLQILGGGSFPTVRFGNSSSVQVGEGVLAFGNSLGLGGIASVTSGTVSGIGRSITATSETGSDTEHLDGMIETDAPIVPGNSGGPLVDASGQVVGMDTAAASAANGAGTTVGFALPISRVAAVEKQIASGQRGRGIVLGRTAYLGIEGTSVSLAHPVKGGAVNVIQVEPGTPASQAGLQAGDIITAFGSVRVTSMGRLALLIDRRHPGTLVIVTFVAGGVARSVRLRLVAGPAA